MALYQNGSTAYPRTPHACLRTAARAYPHTPQRPYLHVTDVTDVFPFHFEAQRRVAPILPYRENAFEIARPRGVVSSPHGERREGGGPGRSRDRGGGFETGKIVRRDALRAKISPPGARFGRKIWLNCFIPSVTAAGWRVPRPAYPHTPTAT